MKRFLMFFSIFSAIFILLAATSDMKTVEAFSGIGQIGEKNTDSFYTYTGEVEHLFTHCLIAFPNLLKGENSMSKHYKADCITPNEFKSVLAGLHKNGYALIDINSVFEEKAGKTVKKKICMPSGKKPLIFSFDDVNYYKKKVGFGMVDRLILTEKGDIASYTNQNGKEIISTENEFLPIMENFIKQHPDFSVNDARGTICLTGYDGILGYRKHEADETKPLIAKLKKLGWNFACHSYGHGHMKKQSLPQFEADIKKWRTEVEPLVGKTNIYVYPYGEWEMGEKHEVLKNNDFKLFCGVGVQTYFSHLPNKEKPLFMDRKPIDGFSLENRFKEFFHLFNTKEVIETACRN